MSCDTHWRQYIVHGPGLSRDILLPSLAVAGHVIEFQYRGLALVSRDKHYTCDVLQSRFFQHYNIIHIFVIRDRENSLSHFLLSDLTNHESRKTPYVLLANGTHKLRIEKISFRTFCYRTSQITCREKRLICTFGCRTPQFTYRGNPLSYFRSDILFQENPLMHFCYRIPHKSISSKVFQSGQ